MEKSNFVQVLVLSSQNDLIDSYEMCELAIRYNNDISVFTEVESLENKLKELGEL